MACPGTSSKNWKKEKFEENKKSFLQLISTYQEEHREIEIGGGAIAIEKQHNKKRLTARERIDQLIDPYSKKKVYAKILPKLKKILKKK